MHNFIHDVLGTTQSVATSPIKVVRFGGAVSVLSSIMPLISADLYAQQAPTLDGQTASRTVTGRGTDNVTTIGQNGTADRSTLFNGEGNYSTTVTGPNGQIARTVTGAIALRSSNEVSPQTNATAVDYSGLSSFSSS